ncbi:ribulose-phosphate 3-epimerase [bacterium]|nr:ribulose-phosphate 3-epimerase [bacterium]
MKISPSILSADFSRLGEQIRAVEKAGAETIHLDIMDGHFVPNISFGPPVVRSIRKATGLRLWSHLMIEEPLRYLEAFRKAGSDGILFHRESVGDAAEMIRRIHDMGMKAGIAINPGTETGFLKDILSDLEAVLIMTVHPGFGGQTLIPETLVHIRETRRLAAALSIPPVIGADGGIDLDTLRKVIHAGADNLVIGSAIFDREDPAEAFRELLKAARQSPDRPQHDTE